MSYKIAIIDDEVLIRKSIALKMTHPAFEITFSSENGLELIDYVREHGCDAVDVVFVDIVMPALSGLELAERLHKICPDLFFVIISGHNDFSYMQKAIRIGVTDYLLKPISTETLNGILEGLVPKLAEKYRKKKLAQKQSMNKILFEGNDDKQEPQLPNMTGGYYIRATMLGNCGGGMSWSSDYNMEELSFVHPVYPNLLIELTSDKRENDFPYVTKTTYISKWHEGIVPTINDEIEHAVSQVRHALTLGRNIVVQEGQPARLGQAGLWRQKADSLIPVISNSILSKEYDKLIRLVEELFTYDDVPQHVVDKTWKRIAAELYLRFDDSTLLDDSWLMGCDTPGDFRSDILYYLRQLLFSDAQQQESYNSGLRIVRETAAYIEEHYMENISIADIAERNFINRSHLSRLFKKEYAKTFYEYVTEIRVKKAVQLLTSGRFSVREVAEMVGYVDQRYFAQIIRKHTGCSPSKIRNQGKTGTQ